MSALKKMASRSGFDLFALRSRRSRNNAQTPVGNQGIHIVPEFYGQKRLEAAWIMAYGSIFNFLFKRGQFLHSFRA